MGRESHSSHRRNSSPEDREYSGYSQADRRGYFYDVSMESQSRDPEKRRKKDADWKRSQKLPSPGKRSPEWAIAQSSTYLLRRQRRTSRIHCSLQIADKNSLSYQTMNWKPLKKSIYGLSKKVSISNISIIIIQDLLQESLVRGRVLLSRSVLQVQSASPVFTHIHATLVARLFLNFRKGYQRNDKQLYLTASKFVVLLTNQNVVHEILCLEMLTLLRDQQMTTLRAQNTIIVVFAIRKDRFKDHPVREGLDLVEEDDQATRVLPLEDYRDPEDVLNVFKMDPNFMENEEKYKAIKKETLDEGDSDSITDHKAGSSEDEDEEEEGGGHKVSIHDKTEINLVLFHHQEHPLLRNTPLRNVAEVFAHLFYTDSLPWSVCECVKLSEETTTSSSRIFVTVFFQKLGEYMGLPELSVRLKDEAPQTLRQPMEYLVCHQLLHFHWSQSLMDELQKHLKNRPQKPEAEQKILPPPTPVAFGFLLG
ncbi:hypothetical protein U0070_009692, partial [Myodes glareolus]